MKFQYTTALDKIRRMEARIRIIPGGSSGGKTIAILAVLIDKAIKEVGISISVCSESLPHLKRGAIKDFLNIMKDTGRYIDQNWNRTNFVYTFTNGSSIEFFGVDSPDKLRGARRNVLYINEANNVPFESYLQLAMRTDGDIYIDYNPSHHFWADDITEDAEKLIITYKDNEGLPQTVIDFLESKLKLADTSEYWKNWCRVYLSGLPGRLEGLVFQNWSEIDRIPENAQLIGYGMDFGYSNDPSTCVGVYKMDNELYLDEIVYRKGLTNSELSALLKDAGVQGEIIADSAEPKSIEELKRYGHRVNPAKKGPDSIRHGINILQEYKMHVTKRSINLKNELSKYEWKKDTQGNTINEPIDAFNHAIDALRYLALIKLGKRPKTSFGFELL